MIPPTTRRLVVALSGVTALAIVTGTVVTGTGPHAGDQDVRRWGFDISDVAGSTARRCSSQWHSDSRSRGGSDPSASRRDRIGPILSTWMFVAVVQGGIGYLQYFTGVPELLVGAHVAGATALWVATVWMCTSIVAADRMLGDEPIEHGATGSTNPARSVPSV